MIFLVQLPFVVNQMFSWYGFQIFLQPLVTIPVALFIIGLS